MNGQLDHGTLSTHLSAEPDTAGDRPPLRILVVDDDPDFVEALATNLAGCGFSVQSHTDGRTALSRVLGGERFDVLLIDWYMPSINGVELLKEIRGSGIETPVIMLTGAAGEVEEDIALGLGATDFVDKSRRFSILVKRIRRIVEDDDRDRTSGTDELGVGDLSLRRRSCRAEWRGQEVALTLTEFRVVEILAAHAGTDLTYREIYDVVHGEGFWAGDGDAGYRVNVRSLIKRIRQKFVSIDPGFQAIENYPGHGYRWRSVDAVVEDRPATGDAARCAL
jgi:two-component system response regulator ChvI